MFLLSLISFVIPIVQSTEYHSAQDGDWTDNNTWNESDYPRYLDDRVWIDHHVTVPSNLQVNATNIYISDSGILNVSEDTSIVFNDSEGCGFDKINGTLYIDGNPNNKVTVGLNGTSPTNYWYGSLKDGSLWYAKHAIFDRRYGEREWVYGKVVWDHVNFTNQVSYTFFINLDPGSSITNSESNVWIFQILSDAVTINNNIVKRLDLRKTFGTTFDNMDITNMWLSWDTNVTFNNLSSSGRIWVRNSYDTDFTCNDCDIEGNVDFEAVETTYYRRLFFNNSNFTSVTNWQNVQVPGSYMISKNHNNTEKSWHGWFYQTNLSNIPQDYKFGVDDDVVINGGTLIVDSDLILGNITVGSDGGFSCNSMNLTLNGDFDISGDVTLNNCPLRVNVSHDGEFGINVLGGKLNIINGSSVTHGDAAVAHWNMNIDDAIEYVFESSTFAYGNNTGIEVIDLINCIDGGDNVPENMWNFGGGYCGGDYSGIGNWIITGAIHCENEVIPLNGNLLIEDGGDLTFNNIVLNVDNNYDGEYWIKVKNGGRFEILNHSLITSTDPDFEYMFEVQPGASFEMNNSWIEECGWNDTYPGLTIKSEYANITNSNFTNCYSGVYLWYANYTKLENNFFNNSDIGVSSFKSSNNYIINNIVNSDMTGIVFNSSPNNQIKNNILNSNNEHGIYLYSSLNNTLDNNTANANVRGIYLHESSNNIVTNNIVNSNSLGIYLRESSNNTLTDNIANANKNSGIYLNSSSNNTIINNTANANSWGIYLYSSTNNTLKDNTANDNDYYEYYGQHYIGYGIYLLESSNNILTNNTANSDTGNYQDYGIYLDSSSNNILTDNVAKRNNNYDIFVAADSDVHCNNIIKNNTGSGDKPLKYFDYPANLQHETLSGLILCNADNSNINNVTVTGSGSKKNNGIFVLRTENSNFTNIKSSSIRGIYLYSSSGNTLSNNIVVNSSIRGIYLYSSSNNTLTNNTVNSNENGVYLESSTNNTLTNNTVNLNNNVGIYLRESSNNNILTDNTVDSNENGIYLESSSNNTLTDNTAILNYDSGILLLSSSSNTLENNTVSSNDWGIRLISSSSDNTLTNNTVNSNDNVGIYLEFSSKNTLTKNTVKENNNYDLFVWGNSHAHCNNIIKNNTGSGDKSIKYFNCSINLENEVFSELILCNADNSNINNVTVAGSDSLKNNGIVALFTDNSNLTNINSSNNRIGIYLRESSSNTLANNTVNSNNREGIYLAGPSYDNPTYDVGAVESSGSGNTYYVSTEGNDDWIGTIDQPWRTIAHAATQAQTGDTVYIKGGVYGEEYIVIQNNGTRGNPIVFQGYKDVPGDTPESDEMPLINRSYAYDTGQGIKVEEKEYIVIRNFKIDKYKHAVNVYRSKHVTLDNIVANSGYEGIIIRYSRYCKVRNTIMTDASMNNFVIDQSHYNIMENCESYGINVGTDYYIKINSGHDNIIRNCLAYNQHYGKPHGIGIKDHFDYEKQEYIKTHSYNNKIINCKSIANWNEHFFVAHGAHHNEFINCTAVRGFFRVRDGAHSNKFIDCKASRVGFDDSPEAFYNQIQKDNTFENCIFRGYTKHAIFFEQAENNSFKNCVIDNAFRLFGFRYNYNGNKITNSIITNISYHNWTDSGSIGDMTITYTNFYDIGFSMPEGTGNMEVNPLFVDWENGDYHLKSAYGRWDGSTWVDDSVTSPCIDAGDPDDDYCKEPQPNGGRINMGAYGNTKEASKNNSSGGCGDLKYSLSNNTIRDSRIEDNVYGIYLSDVGEEGSNLIYNNLFNNSVNFYFEGTVYNNNWNTTKQAGTRIYSGGDEIGGNYWTNPSGTGYSDTCTDDNKDGFCDVPYTLATDNIDYLPLSDKYEAILTITIELPKNCTDSSTCTDGYYYKEKVPLNFTVEPNPDWVGYNLNEGDNVTITENTTLKDGLIDASLNDVTVFANDTSGNEASETRYFYYCLGDISKDRKVDGRDLFVVSRAFGSFPGHPAWNEDADLNMDGKIDGRDIFIVSRNYGKACY